MTDAEAAKVIVNLCRKFRFALRQNRARLYGSAHERTPERLPVEEVLDLLDLEQIEVNIFRGQSPQGPHAARVRRAGAGPGAGRGQPHRRRPHLPFVSRLFSARAAIPRFRFSTKSTAAATARASLRAASSRSSTAIRSSRSPPRSRSRRRVSSISSTCPTCPDPEELQDEQTHRATVHRPAAAGSSATWISRPRPIEMRPVDHRTIG